MKSLLILLQAAEGGDAWMQLWPLLLILVVFYFFFIRPQTKKNKEMKKFREELKKGDKVITLGGIHGKVAEIKETTIIVEVGPQNKLTIEKSAIVMDNTQVGQTK